MSHQPRLDALRGLCITAVFLCHAGYLECGWIGVQVFFVLSGYLITGILLASRQQRAPASSYFGNFYARRALRIFPVYFAYIAAIYVADTLHAARLFELAPPDFGSNLTSLVTYTYNIHRANDATTDGSVFFAHLWSLSIEEQFYLVWPLLIYVLSPRSVYRTCAAIIVAAVAIRGIEALLVWPAAPDARLVASRFVYFFTLSHIDAFALGAWLVFAQADPLSARLVRSAARIVVPLVAVVSAWMLLLSRIAGYPIKMSSLGWPTYLPYFAAYAWGFTLLNVAGALLIANADRLAVVLDNPGLQRLGRVSYGFYIFHLPIIWLAVAQGRYRFSDGGWQRHIIALALFLTIWLVAEISYRFLESPFLRLKARFSPPAASAALPAPG